MPHPDDTPSLLEGDQLKLDELQGVGPLPSVSGFPSPSPLPLPPPLPPLSSMAPQTHSMSRASNVSSNQKDGKGDISLESGKYTAKMNSVGRRLIYDDTGKMIKGVMYESDRIHIIGGTCRYLGTFDTVMEAAVAVDTEFMKLGRPIAALNFPDRVPGYKGNSNLRQEGYKPKSKGAKSESKCCECCKECKHCCGECVALCCIMSMPVQCGVWKIITCCGGCDKYGGFSRGDWCDGDEDEFTCNGNTVCHGCVDIIPPSEN